MSVLFGCVLIALTLIALRLAQRASNSAHPPFWATDDAVSVVLAPGLTILGSFGAGFLLNGLMNLGEGESVTYALLGIPAAASGFAFWWYTSGAEPPPTVRPVAGPVGTVPGARQSGRQRRRA
jgi:hypothetical protein